MLADQSPVFHPVQFSQLLALPDHQQKDRADRQADEGNTDLQTVSATFLTPLPTYETVLCAKII